MPRQDDHIRIRGARVHNLRGVDIDVPLRALTVVTGVSGSGKSSLAFDTLYAEGQRRYVETFSAYARQFLERMDRPDVERVEGIPPAVAIERSQPLSGSRSTVATMSELLDHLKLLWARAGELHCKGCGKLVEREGPQRAAAAVSALPSGTRIILGFDLPLGGERRPEDAAAALSAAGLHRILLGDRVEPVAADGSNLPDEGCARVVVDRLIAGRTARARLLDSFETAFRGGDGRAIAHVLAQGDEAAYDLPFSTGLTCPSCGTGHAPPSPNLFSFNSPVGACETCSGFGRVTGIDWELVVPDVRLSIGQGAVKPLEVGSARKARTKMRAWCADHGVPLDKPWRDLSESVRHAVLHGADDWFGVSGFFKQRERKSYRIGVRVFLARYRGYPPCPDCEGSRLSDEGRAWLVGGRTLPQALALDVSAARDFFRALKPPPALRPVTRVLLREVRNRLDCLDQVGLGYLGLDRPARTLSGGEVQRVNLTAAIGTHLVNTLFVLDEPSVGLHARDGTRLVRLLRTLCDSGNTVVVVEHDPAILAAADYVIDMGPRAGEHGGEVVAAGTPTQLLRSKTSLTAAWLSGRRRMPAPDTERTLGTGPLVGVRGARANNLQAIDLLVHLGELTVLSGVSGSGKSTLAHDTLYLGLARALGRPEGTPGAHDEIVGADEIDDVVLVGQAAAGRTRRANPATYVGAWDGVRQLFARTPEAQEAEFGPGHFSFNVSGGRCDHCEGAGRERVEMQFLSDVEVTCPECSGTRFRREVREILWEGSSITDVLEFTVTQALEHFADVPRVRRPLAAVAEVGLGYLRLGQSLATLSSGEWQRLRLAQALTEKKAARRLYIFDEPTTGLHLEDVAVLVQALRRLTERGHGVLVVEHHLDVMLASDRVVDLGPEGGPEGGFLVADGPPRDVAAGEGHTARYLRAALRGGAIRPRTRKRPKPKATAISVHGAREHNLRNISIDLPREAFVVVSGPSGSGKSTLAFDIVFAEGQRRYIDTLSAYARQFVGRLAKPDVERVSGIPPTVAIEQRRTRGGRRSTVATVTEVAHFLRLLFARAGAPHCPVCGHELESLSADAIHARLLEENDGETVRLLAPVVLGRKGFHKDVFAAMARRGRTHARADGKLVPVDPPPSLDRYREHDIEELVAEIRVGRRTRVKLREHLDETLALGRGAVVVLQEDGRTRMLSVQRTCPRDGATVPELDPRFFSHNSRRGWCPTCRGLGTHAHVDPHTLPVKEDKSLARGAIPALWTFSSARAGLVREARKAFGISGKTLWRNLPEDVQHKLLHGGKGKKGPFVGAAERLQEKLRDAPDVAIDWFGPYVTRQDCQDCGGERLRPEARAVRVGGMRLPELLALPVASFLPTLEALSLSQRAERIAQPIVREIRERVGFLERMGLGYLTQDRTAATLSGGEAQRIRLAAQLGSNLRGICYVLDEPTIGLHPRDNERLLEALQDLRTRGNSLIVVEHDAETIRRADRVIDLGPGGGKRGGQIVAEGTPKQLARNAKSPTGRVLARAAPPLRTRVPKPEAVLRVEGARLHNLKSVNVDVPLGALVCVTGVSGAGKTTLVHGVIQHAVRAQLAGEEPRAGERPYRRVRGVEHIERIRAVDSTPVGKTPRSVPATYLGIWDVLRKAMALTPEARARGYGPGRFSFNVQGGRCDACNGMGEITVEMSFLPNVRVPCDTCGGARFSAETLEIAWRGRNAANLLDLTFEEAATVFADFPKVAPQAKLMNDVGLEYLTLGQPSPTLSGGEAQRLKLVTELGRGGRDGHTLYVLDEPTIGLHGEDVDRLLEVFRRLVDRGDTVLLIEHHLELIAQADHVIDVGPEGGEHGGRVVAAGTPAAVARKRAKSLTGAALHALCNNPSPRPARSRA